MPAFDNRHVNKLDATAPRISRDKGISAVAPREMEPMNRGGLGARSLNIELQKALNPPGEDPH
jgi:hypothetical protein